MVKQQRAALTREALVVAAAGAFDSLGFGATALARVSQAAGISMGALTFHFGTKDELAEAVQRRGRALVVAAVATVESGWGPRSEALPVLEAVTVEVARLLETETVVRAAARLSRERPGADADWTGAWRPAVERLIGFAAAGGELRREVGPEVVLRLAVYLVSGAEAHARALASGHGPTLTSAEASLRRIWALVRPALSARGPHPA